MRSFSERMWRAVAFIESGREHCRQLDEAFENDDGDAMTAALYTLAEKRPVLKANLPKYVLEPGKVNPDVVLPLVGRPMHEIRKAANAMRIANAWQPA
jgi:hypothetical protein